MNSTLKFLAGTTALAVTLTLAPSAAHAQGRRVRDVQGAPRLVAHHTAPGDHANVIEPRRELIPETAPRSTDLPTPGRARVELMGSERPTQAGRLPVQIAAVSDGSESSGGQVRAVETELLGSSPVAQSTTVGPVVRLSDAEVQPTDHKSGDEGASSTARLRVLIDLSAYVDAYGQDWANRAQLVQTRSCPSSAGGCRTPLVTQHVGGNVIAAIVEVPVTERAPVTPEAEAPTAAMGDTLIGRVPARYSARTASAIQTSMLEPSSTTVAVTSQTSSPTGDWSSTSLRPSATWQAGGSTGSFSWSYGLRMPPVAGALAPSVGFSYDSGSVDGLTSATNNQASWVGEGFGYNPGFIERTYRPCSKDGHADSQGDLCWRGDQLSLSFGEHAGELIPIGKDADGNAVEFRLRADDGTRIQRLGTIGTAGERFVVTTPDGTKFTFGADASDESGDTIKSAWQVPVVSDDPDEPCYGQGTGYADRFCTMTWRWNLDTVEDRRGNTMRLLWDNHTNMYDRNRNMPDRPGTPVVYDRGGVLTRIEYGLHTSTPTAAAAAWVDFTAAERCVPVAGTDPQCDPEDLTANSAQRWPDVPFDLICSAGDGQHCEVGVPSFFTRKKLSAVATYVRTPGGSRLVDQWTLTHQLLDTGDGTVETVTLPDGSQQGIESKVLLLKAIEQANLGAPTTFTYQAKANRVDGIDNAMALTRFRVVGIADEYGATTAIAYTDPQCWSIPRPAPDDVAQLRENTQRCFPSRYVPPGAELPEWHWFNKYLVTQVTQDDGITLASDTVVSTYNYLGKAGWAYDDNPGTLTEDRTWNQWRGYEQVETLLGDPADGAVTAATQPRTVTTYFRGLRSGNGPSDPDDPDDLLRVTDIYGAALLDKESLAGRIHESITYLGATGPRLASTVSTYVLNPTPSVRPGGHDAVRVLSDSSTTRRTTHNNLVDKTTVATSHDSYGRPTLVHDLAERDGALVDGTCTMIGYATNATAWILTPVATQTLRNCGRNLNGDGSGTLLGMSETYYDNLPGLGAAPTQGLPTKTRVAKNDAGTEWITTRQIGYDAFGRPLTLTDAELNTSTTSYTSAVSGGAPTKVVATSPDPDATGPLTPHTTTTDLDPAWGTPTKVIAPDATTTTAAYDSLGRLETVFLPGNTSPTPDLKYAYTLLNSVQNTTNAIATTTRTPAGTITSTELFDGMLRPLETQARTMYRNADSVELPGSLTTRTTYDSRGLPVRNDGGIVATTTPSNKLINPLPEAPQFTTITYDGAQRVINSTLSWKSGALDGSYTQAPTLFRYDGDDLTTVTPPAGGTTRQTYSDGRGRATLVREWLSRLDASAGFVDTEYDYTVTGLLDTITDDAGNVWDYGYDILGRRTQAIDPDAGISSSTYTDLGQVQTSTDPTGTLTYDYDHLGRLKTLRQGQETRASWTYDSNQFVTAQGHQLQASRYEAGQPVYTTRVDAIDTAGRITKSSAIVAATNLVPAQLAGTYTNSVSYHPDGSVATTTHDAAGTLPEEIIEHTYDDLGRPSTMMGSLGSYISHTAWSPLGQPERLTYGNTYGQLAWQALTYDTGLGRLSRSQVSRQAREDFDERLFYNYDQSGNITDVKVTAADEDETTDVGDPIIELQCFRHDGLNQLTAAWTPAAADCAGDPSTVALGGPAAYSQTWTYDQATGNRLTEAHRTLDVAGVATKTDTAYAYPDPGQPQPHGVLSTSTVTSIGTAPAGSPVVKDFTYNQRGDTTARNQAVLDWDVEGHLASVTPQTEGAAAIQQARYDADGNRYLRRTQAAITLYLPSGTELSIALDTSGQPNGSVTGSRYYQFAGQTVALRQGGSPATVTSLFADPQGTANYAFKNNNTTSVLQTRRQTPFGGDRSTNRPTVTDTVIDHMRPGAILPTATWPGDRSFVGGRTDITLDLNHIGAREYDPALGRFLSVDPLLVVGDSRQANGYAYAASNPITYSDPSGLVHTSVPREYRPGPSVSKHLPLPVTEDQWVEQMSPDISNPYDLRTRFDVGRGSGAGTGPDPLNVDGDSSCYYRAGCDAAWKHLGSHPDDVETAKYLAAMTCVGQEAECQKYDKRGIIGVLLLGVLGGGKSVSVRPPTRLAGPATAANGGSRLADASAAAFRAADDPASIFIKNKHLASAGGNQAKFVTDDISEIQGVISRGLRSGGVQFLPNGLDGTFRAIVPAGRTIGTKGQTNIRVVVTNDGRVINAFPVNVR